MRRKICLPKKGLAFRKGDKRDFLSTWRTRMTLFMRFALSGHIPRLRFGLTLCSNGRSGSPPLGMTGLFNRRFIPNT